METAHFSHEQKTDIPLISIFSFHIKASLLQEGVSFDLRYFMYMGDFDPFRTIRLQGRWVFFQPQMSVKHLFDKGFHKRLRLLVSNMPLTIGCFSK
jgi:GT2 family glycosyltransferase